MKNTAQTLPRILTGRVYRFGHDLYGNPIAHWDITTPDGRRVAGTKRRREQTGYRTDLNEPMTMWAEAHGYAVTRTTGDRVADQINFTLTLTSNQE